MTDYKLEEKLDMHTVESWADMYVCMMIGEVHADLSAEAVKRLEQIIDRYQLTSTYCGGYHFVDEETGVDMLYFLAKELGQVQLYNETFC